MKDLSTSALPYSVRLLTNDLSHEELIFRIADSLDQLQVVIEDMFSKVTSKVAANRARLDLISERSQLAQLKVDHLKGRRKATQVFSTSKFPAAEKLAPYHLTFTQRDEKISQTSRQHKLRNRRHLPPNDDNLRSKLKFYSVKVPKHSSSESVSSEGLGRLPSNMDSISSLLLFNTTENPYKKYVMLDPRGVVTKMREVVDEGALGPADAPTTIALGEVADEKQQETYIYRPDLGEVPAILVPDTLPDLLHVADDLRYGAETGPSIAPSVFGLQDLPDLPSVSHDPADAPSQSNPPPPPPPPPPPVESVVAAPPPPPPPQQAVASVPTALPRAVTASTPAAPSSSTPAAAPAPTHVAASAQSDDKTDDSGDGGGRGGLLAAIRNAGGADKLKKASERKGEKKKKKKDEQDVAMNSGGGGDLMSDLASMLSMRRRGIAGANTGKSSSASPAPAASDPSTVAAPSGVMSKISELIPYSPVAEGQDDDADWDD